MLKLLEINFTRNDFEFNGEHFLQICGTAMGKKFAPSYANINMAAWEAGLLQELIVKPTLYFRYLDDVFGVWSHSIETFNQFITLAKHTFKGLVKFQLIQKLYLIGLKIQVYIFFFSFFFCKNILKRLPKVFFELLGIGGTLGDFSVK